MKHTLRKLIAVIAIILLLSGCAPASEPVRTLSPGEDPHIPIMSCIIDGISYHIGNELINLEDKNVDIMGKVTPFSGGADEFDEEMNLIAPHDVSFLSDYGDYAGKMYIRLNDGWHSIFPDVVQPKEFFDRLLEKRNIKLVSTKPVTEVKPETRYFSQGIRSVSGSYMHETFYEFIGDKFLCAHTLFDVDGAEYYNPENHPWYYENERSGFYEPDYYTLFKERIPFTGYNSDPPMFAEGESEFEAVRDLYGLRDLGVIIRTTPMALYEVEYR